MAADLGQRAERAAARRIAATGRRVHRRRSPPPGSRARDAAGSRSATIAAESPRPAIRMRFRPMPARQRRSSASRTHFARGVREGDVEDEEERPDQLRDLEAPCRLGFVRGEVGLHVEQRRRRSTTASMVPTSSAKNSSIARAAAAQAVDALQLKGERRQRGHERQHVQVLLEAADSPW